MSFPSIIRKRARFWRWGMWCFIAGRDSRKGISLRGIPCMPSAERMGPGRSERSFAGMTRAAHIYSNNCGQRVVLPSGEILMSFTFGPAENHRMVAGVKCSFDGEELKVVEVGPPLMNNVGRGLLEPSVTEFQGRYYLTIRAEDGWGYVAVSEDGLNYQSKTAWAYDDGTPLEMSTTQQHWLVHSEGLFLVYTPRIPRTSTSFAGEARFGFHRSIPRSSV